MAYNKKKKKKLQKPQPKIEVRSKGTKGAYI